MMEEHRGRASWTGGNACTGGASQLSNNATAQEGVPRGPSAQIQQVANQGQGSRGEQGRGEGTPTGDCCRQESQGRALGGTPGGYRRSDLGPHRSRAGGQGGEAPAGDVDGVGEGAAAPTGHACGVARAPKAISIGLNRSSRAEILPGWFFFGGGVLVPPKDETRRGTPNIGGIKAFPG